MTVETAEALCRDAERRLTEMVARLEPVPDRPTLRSLYDGNLISGVVWSRMRAALRGQWPHQQRSLSYGSSMCQQRARCASRPSSLRLEP